MAGQLTYDIIEHWDELVAQMKADTIAVEKAECVRCQYGVCPKPEHWEAKRA